MTNAIVAGSSPFVQALCLARALRDNRARARVPVGVVASDATAGPLGDHAGADAGRLVCDGVRRGRAGDVEVLRNIQPKLVNAVRFYDGPTATGRWGVDNGAGVIHISTWNDGAGGIPLPDRTRGATKPVKDSSSKR